MTKITGFDTFDIRFPTSLRLDGSDAMNPSPDYSAAYLVIRTDEADPADAGGEPLSGYSFVFTIGPGNDVQLAAIRMLEPFLVGRDLDEVLADLGGLYRALVGLQPDALAGARMRHRAHGGRRRRERVLGPGRAPGGQAAVAAARRPVPGGARRLGRFPLSHRRPHPGRGTGAAGTRPGGQGRAVEGAAPGRLPGLLHDAGLARLLRRHASPRSARRRWPDGFTQVKLKVGARLDDDKRRCAIARETVGEDVAIAIDANQVWDVPTAIAWIRELAPVRPAWIEEPTSP